MAKIYGLQGLATGKLGATVFAIRNGVQIARQYNPSPADAKSEGQVANRAKLKLLSQLSQAVASVIAIPRRGLVSARNTFLKVNYEYVGYNGSEASIPMADILLTNSYAGLPGLLADRSSGTAIHVELLESAVNNWDKVVYVVLRKTDSQQIMPATSMVVDAAGDNGLFPADLPMVSGAISVHAYGIRLNTVNSRVAFSNLKAPRAEDVAKIVASRTYNEGDMALSETRGLYMESNETQQETSGVSTVLISLRAVNLSGVDVTPGTVSGGGRFELGSEITLTATPAENYVFRGWRFAGTTAYISTSATFTTTAAANATIEACFENPSLVTYTASAVRNSVSTGQGTITGGGQFAAGATVTLTATANEGSTFEGWYSVNGSSGETNRVSTAATYTFTMPSSNVSYYALFLAEGEGGDD